MTASCGVENQRGDLPVAAIFDLDGTITRRGTYTPFVLHVANEDRRKFLHVGTVLGAALLYKCGALSRGRLKEIMLRVTLKGASRAEVSAYAGPFVERWVAEGLRLGAVETIAKHKAAGDYLILATASFDFYADDFGARLGFDKVVATKVVWQDNQLCGTIDGENCRGKAKLRQVHALMPDIKERYRVIAYSDHHVDLPLLQWADEAMAVNPTMGLKKIALREGMQIIDWNVTAAKRP